MTTQNPFGKGLDVLRQLGASQGQIRSNEAQKQMQQLRALQEERAAQGFAQQQEGLQRQQQQAEQRQFFDLLTNVRQLPAEQRMQALQSSPFAQSEDFDQFITPETMSDQGLDQILAANPYAQAGQESLKFGAVNPRDFTAESLAKYQETGNYGDLVRYAPMKKTIVGGITYFADDAGNLFLPVTQEASGEITEATDQEIDSGEAVPSPQPVDTLTVEEQIQTQADIAGAKTTATETAKQEITLSASDQQAYDSAQRTLGTMQQIIESPALSSNIFTGALGAGSITPPLPGTPEADFRSYFETLKAQQFTNEISKLRGMGSLSDTEGRKVAAAAAALELNMSPEAFKNQLEIIRSGLETLKPPGYYTNEEASVLNWDDL